MTLNRRHEQKHLTPASLTVLTAAALVLPGLMQAADEDGVDFQYSHYQEGKRNLYGMAYDQNTAASNPQKLPNNLNPIEVDTIHGSARFKLTDRIKFAFNYTQDTWSGATPIGTMPVMGNGNGARYLVDDSNKITGISGASPYANTFTTVFMVKNLRDFYLSSYDPDKEALVIGDKYNQLTHVLSYASPETRKQGDFKLSYEWDEAALDIGGGISIENDYESRFGNIGGRFDFNQKQTTLNWGVSYTNSDTYATLDPDALPFITTLHYDDSFMNPFYDDKTGQFIYTEEFVEPLAGSGAVKSLWSFNAEGIPSRSGAILYGNRQDWGNQLGLTQVLGKNAVLVLDFGYTRSTGYLGNPYKVVYGPVDPSMPAYLDPKTGTYSLTELRAFLESRPGERNLFTWHIGYDRFIEPLNAVIHADYSFAHDDWGINAHTFEADWVQPLTAGWTVTPRIRYYSQSAADFYTHLIYSIGEPVYDNQGNISRFNITKPFPMYYSSHQRLSGFGALSGGVTIAKQFSKGVSLETGIEYYTHQGGLKIGGGGEDKFADYDFWVANAALKVKLDALNAPGSNYERHRGHSHHSGSPAGVMFDHTLPEAGDFMVGYRFMRNEQAGDMLRGSHSVSLATANLNGCAGQECAVTPKFMSMNMHMLDLMYAPTDWLTLMLMPQWLDMDMTMAANPNVTITAGHGGHSGHGHQTGGIGDFGAYALFKVLDHTNHHLTVSLGGTAPTGDVDIVQRKTGITPIYSLPIHYGMQLGSGTWDFKPALTYTGNYDQFLWGAQANATIRLEDSNESGFAFGDIVQGMAWGGFKWTDWLATTVRCVYTAQGAIRGSYPVPTESPNIFPPAPFLPQHIGPFDFPANYGGSYADLGLGINVNIPNGSFAGNTLKFEWLQPVYTNFNGYQPDRNYALNFTWSYGF